MDSNINPHHIYIYIYIYIYIPAVCDLLEIGWVTAPSFFLFQAVIFSLLVMNPSLLSSFQFLLSLTGNYAVEIHANYCEAPQSIFDLSINNFSQSAMAFVIRQDVFSTACDCFSFRLNLKEPLKNFGSLQ